MAFGKHAQVYLLDNLDKEHFLVFAIEAALKLGWSVSFVTEAGFIAYTKFSWRSWSEEVTVKIDNEKVNIKSDCTGIQIIDWGKNKKNIADLLSKFEEIKIVLTPEELASKLTELRQKYDTKYDNILRKPPSFNKEKITGFLSIFKLKAYCELRFKSYELIYKTISEDTDKYEKEINEYNQKIESIVAELTATH